MMIRCVGRNTVDTICHYTGWLVGVSNNRFDTGFLSSTCNPPADTVVPAGGGALFDVECALDDVARECVGAT
jgi:hypothetical protein